jgi:hypothetical protein
MRIIQFEDRSVPSLGVVVDGLVYNITRHDPNLSGVPQAFQTARRQDRQMHDLLTDILKQAGSGLDYSSLLADGRVMAPINARSALHVLVSGTGLTHLGSVQQRDAMHRAAQDTGPKTDSQRMFEMGLAGGKPAPGVRGTAPEWFYKGDGRILRGPGEPLEIPSHADDGGEEPEVAVIYAIDDAGIPCRLGFVQGNEWSDHVQERVNYLYLAPSKLRTCAIGPELVTDVPFDDIHGRCRVLRDGNLLYDSGELLTGQDHLCHSLANIEDHHFKHAQHRHPGDVHVHFLGTSKLSFGSRDWQYQTGDIVEISFNGLGPALRNPVQRAPRSATPIVTGPG